MVAKRVDMKRSVLPSATPCTSASVHSVLALNSQQTAWALLTDNISFQSIRTDFCTTAYFSWHKWNPTAHPLLLFALLLLSGLPFVLTLYQFVPLLGERSVDVILYKGLLLHTVSIDRIDRSDTMHDKGITPSCRCDLTFYQGQFSVDQTLPLFHVCI